MVGVTSTRDASQIVASASRPSYPPLTKTDLETTEPTVPLWLEGRQRTGQNCSGLRNCQGRSRAATPGEINDVSWRACEW